jgi:hypothetical protein
MSKLLDVLLARELASRIAAKDSSIPVIVNSVNPGFCRTQLFHNLPFPFVHIADALLLFFGRSGEAGSQTFLFAAAGEKDTHGRYMDKCVIADESDFARSEEGFQVQRRAFDELLQVLESIEPGISKVV